ncbi:MAG: GNAT family N-acetyltransferase [bacterium]|nr:GNAT family N-acetyltransferase [bacterium]
MEISYSIKRFEKVPEDIEKQIKDLKHLCFSKFRGETPQEIAENDDRFYNNKAAVNIVALENDKVIGYLGTLKRDIIFNDQEIILGGLGGVCTSSEKRNRRNVGGFCVFIEYN